MLLLIILSIFISSEDSKVIFIFKVIFTKVEKVLFSISLIGTTIQDSSTRARRDVDYTLYLSLK